MSLIQWQDSYSVGVPMLDSDHKILISLLNQLYDAREEGQSQEVIGSVLNVLVEYTINHFAREERLMEIGGYPHLEEHRKEHRRLTNTVREYHLEYINGRHTAVSDVFELLKDWLIKHILIADSRYQPYVENVDVTSEEVFENLAR